MSEYQLAYDQNAHQRSSVAHQPVGGQVDWYQTGGTDYADTGFGYGAPSTSAGGFGSFEDEEPLLTELGIDVSAILRRSRAILLNRLGSNEMLELDLGGPLFFALLLGSVHLLVGKLHFGVILGWNVVASLAVWFVVNNLAGMDGPDSHGLGIYDCCCLLGYGQVPLLLHALVSLLLPRGVYSVLLAALAVVWAARTAGKLFSHRSSSLKEHQSLVTYPCFLTYTAFALLTIY